MKIVRLIGGLLCVSAILLAAGFFGNGDFEHELIQGEARPHRREHAELLCQCPRIDRSAMLRIAVTHQPDRDFCHAVCCYDDGGECKAGRP